MSSAEEASRKNCEDVTWKTNFGRFGEGFYGGHSRAKYYGVERMWREHVTQAGIKVRCSLQQRIY